MPPERSAGSTPASGWRALPALALALALAACGGGGGGGAPTEPATTDAGTRVDPTVYSSAGSAALAQAVEGTSMRRLQLAMGPRTLSYTARAGHVAVPDASGRTQASVFHVSYMLEGMAATQRPVMFFYNGGPGSATVWLHLGSFGPRRIAVGTPVPPAPPPYPLVDNAETLLDAADLVFVDAVGAGYSQAVSPYTNQSFWGVDADAALFRDFVRRWLAQNGREAAPKYLYGESYGGPRTAVLASLLETAGVRLAGVTRMKSSPSSTTAPSLRSSVAIATIRSVSLTRQEAMLRNVVVPLANSATAAKVIAASGIWLQSRSTAINPPAGARDSIQFGPISMHAPICASASANLTSP